MKKIMIALAAIVAACVVNAAQVSWSSGRIAPSAGDEGGWGTGNITGDAYTATIYFWMVADDAGDLSKAITAIGGSDITGTSTSTISSKALKGTTSDVFANGVYYTLMEVVNENGSKITSSVASFTVDNSSLDPTVSLNFYSGTGFNETFDGTPGAFGAAGWTAAVPEPTSGLLMLVGLGALALRRRRA